MAAIQINQKASLAQLAGRCAYNRKDMLRKGRGFDPHTKQHLVPLRKCLDHQEF